MKNTPKSLRLQIAIFGRTHVGKGARHIGRQDGVVGLLFPGAVRQPVEVRVPGDFLAGRFKLAEQGREFDQQVRGAALVLLALLVLVLWRLWPHL